jgi:hypothetical protein
MVLTFREIDSLVQRVGLCQQFDGLANHCTHEKNLHISHGPLFLPEVLSALVDLLPQLGGHEVILGVKLLDKELELLRLLQDLVKY